MTRLALVPLVIVGLLAVSCGGDDTTEPPASTTASTPASTTQPATTGPPTTLVPTTIAPTTTPPSTTEPAPVCDPTGLYDEVDSALALARLEPVDAWTPDASGAFFERTVDADDFADRLAFDCATVVADADRDRLLIGAWIGPRMVYVIQDAAPPATPYAPQARVTIITQDPLGEFLRDDNSLWAGTLEGGESLVVGHVDYNLGATLKSWQVAVPPFGEAEPTLPAERHAIATLRAVGGRNVSVAQPAEFGAVEGIVQLISPTGQILLVDTAPAGTFDPLVPRYLEGDTVVEVIDDIEIRRTDGVVDEYHLVPTEIGFACGDYGWILEPPINGTGAEMFAFARQVIESGACAQA